jgi:hypothetical protein
MPLSAERFLFLEADRHVLRGDPAIDLKPLLQVAWEGDKSGSFADYLAAHDPPDAVVEFRPTFLYPANQPVFANFGIEITRGSGILRRAPGRLASRSRTISLSRPSSPSMPAARSRGRRTCAYTCMTAWSGSG